jgi:TrmH family RNA methyltransferase
LLYCQQIYNIYRYPHPAAMPGKDRIKLIRSLGRKKYRQQHGLFIAEGPRTVRDILVMDPERIHCLYATASGREAIGMELPEGIDHELIDPYTLKQLSRQSTPQDILVLVSLREAVWDGEAIRNSWSLVLDRIQDPGNMGNIIRIAAWFGIGNIICSPDSADVYNPKTVQASMGSFLRVNVFYRDLPGLLEGCRAWTGFRVYGTVLDGKSIYDEPFTGKGFIVLGNESQGISPGLLPLLDHRIMIPSHAAAPRPDSLNVAAAAAVVCAELRRVQAAGPPIRNGNRA